MGMEYDWTRKYEQSYNEICLFLVDVMNKAFLLYIAGAESDLLLYGTGSQNSPSKCQSMFRELILP